MAPPLAPRYSFLRGERAGLHRFGLFRIQRSMPSRRHFLWHPRTRRLTSLAVLLAIVWSFVPLPVPSQPPVGKDLSRPFPCQNRPCGCRSADQCWKQCCCFTHSQKVAWARTNGVAIPDFVVTAARDEANALAGQQLASACCQSPPREAGRSARCTHTSGGARRQCCRQAGPRVITVAALSCQGHDWQWFSLPWIVASIPLVSHDAAVAISWIPWESDHALRATRCPPTPPPRARASRQACLRSVTTG